MTQNTVPNQKTINLELPDALEAVYANLAVITHSPSEIIMDFARLLPNTPKGKVYARVIMTPMNAKLFLRALQTNLGKYEEQFGEIKTLDQGLEERSMGFPHASPGQKE
jgi:hypothetical protein